MRILHLSSLFPPHQVGGAEKVVSVLANAQSELGHEVGVAFLVPDDERSTPQEGPQRYPLRRGNLLWAEDSAKYPGPIRVLNKLLTVINFRSATEFGRIIDRFQPEIVNTHSLTELPPLVWTEVHKRRVPLVHTLHDYDLLCVRASLAKDGRLCVPRHFGCVVISRWKTRFHSHIDAVIAVSQSVLDKHREFGLFSSLPPERRKVIWNPVQSGTAIRAHREVQAGVTFGFLGRLVPEKGIEVLLGACKLLPQHGWRLVIGGVAPDGSSSRYAELAGGLPVEFKGFVNPANFLTEVDVLVVPSIWTEPFGLTVVEAFAAGANVIGARSGAVTELVERIKGAYLVQPGDPADLARKMREVILEGPTRPDLKAVHALLDELSPKKIARRYVDVYRQSINDVSFRKAKVS